MKTITVIGVGTPVIVGLESHSLPDKIDGVVTSISLMASHHVRYLVAWWSGRDKKEMWFEEFEVECQPGTELTKIGFQ